MAVLVKPRAGRNRIEGVGTEASGGAVLRVSVTEAPEKGRANAALVKLLAKEWRLPKTAFAIAAGAGARRKTLVITGDGAVLIKRLTEWTRKRHG